MIPIFLRESIEWMAHSLWVLAGRRDVKLQETPCFTSFWAADRFLARWVRRFKAGRELIWLLESLSWRNQLVFNKSFATFGLLVTLLSGSAAADVYRHIDELSLSIQRKSRLLLRESVHYRHTPEYRHLLNDSREIYLSAVHLHVVALRRGSLAHLESDLREIDCKFHHLESVFDRVERNAAYGHGHVHGYTGHVKELLNAIANDIHHLQADIRSLRTPVHVHPSVSVSRPPVHVAPRSGYFSQHHSNGSRNHLSHGYPTGVGRGITFGSGSTRFSISF